MIIRIRDKKTLHIIDICYMSINNVKRLQQNNDFIIEKVR